MAKWQTGPLNFKQHKPRPKYDDFDDFQAKNLGTETGIYSDGRPDHRPQSWDDFVNKTGREKGAKVEVIDPNTGATSSGHIGYMDKKRDTKWDNFVGGTTPKSADNFVQKKYDKKGNLITSQSSNAAIERLNVGRLSDEEEGEDSDDEGKGPGTKDVVKVMNFADHQRIKLERLFDKCKDGREVFIPVMPSKIPERDVNQVREFQHNIMGSCAGAGSGEFHAFRKSRRREYARQSIMKYRSLRDEANAAYKAKVEGVASEQDAKTAKKRAKRLKEKLRKRQKGKEKKEESDKDSDESEDDEEDKEKDPEVKKPDPYDDPLMQHPKPGPALVIPGQFSVL